MRRIRILLLLLAAGCSAPFAGYEVPTLPEEVIGKTINRITGGLVDGDIDAVLSVFSEDFRTEQSDPGRWIASPEKRGIEVHRWEPSPRGAESPDLEDLDLAGARRFWKEYLDSFRTIVRAQRKHRIMNVREPDAACTFYLDIHGIDAGGRFRNDRLWIRFQLLLGERGWLVTGQRMLEGDRTFGTRTWFRDIARENGTVYAHNAGSTLGPEEMERQTFPLTVRGDSGIAAADYDGDGWTDLFYCDGERNVLLRNKGDGSFEDVTDVSGLDRQEALSRSAMFADFDNDGDLDLYVTYEQAPCRFYENLGNGKLRNITERTGLAYHGFATSIAVADYDNDGLLDIYLGCYGDFYHQFPTMKHKNGDPNRLYRNVGGLRFEDVTEKTGVGDRGWTLACTWGDYDNDGDVDLFVCNDFGENSLFRNEGGWFSDVTYISGVSVDGFGMSASFGDFDNDGDLDVYLSGMYSNAGQWIFNRDELLPVPNFLNHIRQKVMGMLDFMTDGNRLLRNEGNGKFTEIAKQAGVNYGQFSWCSPWLDFDNDGDLDIYCVNGFWTGPDTTDL